MHRPRFPPISVAFVKKPRSLATKTQAKERTSENVVQVTRIKSSFRGSLKTNRPSVSAAPTTSLHQNVKTPSFLEMNNVAPRPQLAHSLKHSKNPMSLMRQISRITPLNSFATIPSAGSFNASSIATIIQQTTETSKSSRISFGDPRQLYTVGKENIKKKKYCKWCSSCSPFVALLLVLMALLLLGLIAMIPAVIITLKTTTATTTISTNQSTSGLNTTLAMSTGSSSTTTVPTTSASITSAASTVTITSNICTSTLSGIQMVANCNPCYNYSYYTFTYNYTAVANATRLVLAFRRQTYYFTLDDISVIDYVSPSTELIVNGGFETGTISPWLYCNQNNASNTGGVKANNTYTYNGFNYYSKTGTYFYVGGSNVSADYISQSFSTIIGHGYRVLLSSLHPGSGSPTSADLFLGV